jgi:hypothetical protein
MALHCIALHRSCSAQHLAHVRAIKASVKTIVTECVRAKPNPKP